MNTAVEADGGNAVLRARAKRALQSWTDRLCKITNDGIDRHQIDPNIDPQSLSLLIIGTLEGALLISRLQRDRQPLQYAKQHLDDYLDRHVRAKPRRK